MSRPYVAVEVLDTNNIWQDVTADVIRIQAQNLGSYPMRERPALFSGVGRCDITLNNTSRAYNPDVDGVSTALLDCDRRVRVKYTGTNYGKAMSAAHSGFGEAGYFSQTVTVSVSPGDVLTLTWYARAQFDSQNNTDHVQIVTSGESGTSTLKTYTNKWAVYTLTLTATASATTVTVKFIPDTGSTPDTRTVEYKACTLQKNGGANLLVNGDFASGSLSPWTVTDVGSVSGTVVGYDSANQDTDVFLQMTPGTGGKLTISGTYNWNIPIGTDGSGDRYEEAQSFKPAASGYLDRLTFFLGTNYGTPTGTMTWKVYVGTPGSFGDFLASGTVTPAQNLENQIVVTTRPYVDSSTTYSFWLTPTTTQATGNFWVWKAQQTSCYADGAAYYKKNGGSWTADGTADVFGTVTTVVDVVQTKTRLAQVFKNQLGVAATITKTSLWLKKIGSPTGTLTLRAETVDSNGRPTGTLIDPNATATVAESSLATSYGWIDFTYGASWSLPATGKYALVLSTSRSASTTNYVAWGADSTAPSYLPGSLYSYVSSNWVPEGKDACFAMTGTAPSTTVCTVIDDYKIRFVGFIDSIQPSPFVKGGDRRCVISCLDFTQVLRKQMINVALQENKRGDELITTVLASLQSGSLTLTMPGTQLDTGKATFPVAFDGYNTQTSILDVIRDVCLSEGPFLSFMWIDLDGTLRWAGRTYIARLTTLSTPRLTLAGKDVGDPAGDPFSMIVSRTNALRINQTVLTCHPRQVVTGPVVLGQSTAVITVPSSLTGTQVTLSYRDPTTGRRIGGRNVLTPVAGTDYTFNDRADGGGFDYTNNPNSALLINTVGGSQMTLTLYDFASGPLYVTKLQCRGDMVLVYDPLTITKTHTDVLDNVRPPSPYAADLVFCADNVFVDALANYVLNRYNTPFMEAQQVQVEARAAIQGVDLLDIEIADLVNVSDPQVGMTSAKKHVVTSVSYDLRTDLGGIAAGTVTFGLMRVEDDTYWILGDPTYGVLGSTTRLWV